MAMKRKEKHKGRQGNVHVWGNNERQTDRRDGKQNIHVEQMMKDRKIRRKEKRKREKEGPGRGEGGRREEWDQEKGKKRGIKKDWSESE